MPSIEARRKVGLAAVEAGSIDDHVADADAAVDAVTNIMHWCEGEGVEPDRVLNMAAIHFNAERSS